MKTAFIILFIIYLIVLAKVILFKDALFFQIVPTSGDYQQQSADRTLIHYNPVPFRTILRFLRDADEAPRFFNLYGNIILFIPFGFFLPIIFQSALRFRVVLFWTVLLSLGFEIYQLLTRTGQADIDDVILNTTGGIIGYLFISIYFRSREQKQLLHPRWVNSTKTGRSCKE